MTLADLPNDILLEIVDHLTIPRRRRNFDSPTPVKHLSMVSRQFRALLGPLLLSSITPARRDWSLADAERPWEGWHAAHSAMHGLSYDMRFRKRDGERYHKRHQARYLDNIRAVHLDLFGREFGHSNHPTSKEEPAQRSHKKEREELAIEYFRIITFLRRLNNLQRLQMNIPDPYANAFKEALESSSTFTKLEWVNITTILVDCKLSFLLYHCPNVRKVALYKFTGNDRYYQLDILDLAKYATKIVHLETDTGFTLANMDKVGAAYPQLRYFSVHDYTGTPAMPDFMSLIGNALKHLQTFVLPEAGQMIVDWLNCDQDQRRTAESNAASLVFQYLVSLQDLWFGDHASARRLRSDERIMVSDGVVGDIAEQFEDSNELPANLTQGKSGRH
jgi:hypothetical protein